MKDGHYDGTIFHRVIPGFMIQGGGFKPDMQQKTTRPPIPLESRNGLSNVRGSIAMARTAVPDSATSQFFINLVDNTMLDQPSSRDGNGYAVFGKVIEGMDVVDKIKDVPTGSAGMHQNVPADAGPHQDKPPWRNDMTKTVKLETTAGTIVCELDDAKARPRWPTSCSTWPRATTTAPCSTA